MASRASRDDESTEDGETGKGARQLGADYRLDL